MKGPSIEQSSGVPRICLLTESFHPKIGGGEAHARLLSTTLVRRGVPVFVMTQRQVRSWPRVDEVDGVPVRRVGVPGSARFGKFLMIPGALLSLLYRRRDYDIVYVCGFRTLGPVAVLVARLTGARCVLRAESCAELSGQDPIHLGRANPSQRLFGALLRARNRLLMRADRFLSISRAITREFLDGGVPSERIVAITNGIDVDRFVPVAGEDKGALRRRLGLPDRFLCVFTGKLNRGKGLEMLLRAWRRLVEQHPQLHLVLVGSGAAQFLSCEAQLRAFVEAHGLERSVTFAGAVGDVETYLGAADLFVFPSESEALGISLIEAMASGVPVISTCVGGIPDVVDDRVNGRLIEVGDEEGLVAAVEDLVRHPETGERFARAARRKAVDVFSIEAVAEAHEQLFRSLLRSPAAPAVGSEAHASE